MNYLTTSVAQNQKALANFVDTLVEYDSFGNVIPCLAESWESAPETWTDADGQQHEGQKWTFHLRKTAKRYTCEGEEYAPVTANGFVYAARLVADSKFDSDMPDMLILRCSFSMVSTTILLNSGVYRLFGTPFGIAKHPTC